MDPVYLTRLAQRVRAKFRGRLPASVSPADCLQDCVTKLLELEQQQDRVPEGVTLEAWLVTRAHGDLQDQYGRVWRGENLVKGNPLIDYDSAAEVNDVGRADAIMDVRAAVESLEGVEKQCMLLTLEGKTQEQIAAIIHHTQPSVSQIIRRARAKMRPLLAGYEEEE